MKLRKLSLKDKGVFNKYLNLKERFLSVYNFNNIYIWRALFDISWQVVSGNLCVFFKDRLGVFLYLPPLGKSVKPQAVHWAFKTMDSLNRNPQASRIDNVEEEELGFYQGLGYSRQLKSCDFLYLRRDLAELKGNRFKSQRASYNYFVKNNRPQCLPFSPQHRQDVLRLYRRWAKKRKQANKNPLYQWMLQDSLKALEVLFKSRLFLQGEGLVIKIGGRICAFTFGFKLNSGTFCVLYEIVDLDFKGLAQFLFRSFCEGLKEYKYINAMDDSGLENLKRVKFSYRPLKLVPAYSISRSV